MRMGQFVDDIDGKTAETGLSIAQADIQIAKFESAFAQTSEGSPTTTHDADGWYQIPVTVTDTDTLGPLIVQITKAGALQVSRECHVLPVNVYDSLYSTDKLQVDVTQIEGSDATNQIRDAVVDDSTRIDASELNTLSGHDPGATLGTGTAPAGEYDTEMGRITGNVALASGVDLVAIHGTALTETSGQLAAAFKKFFDVATPTGTINSLPDAVAGAAGGVFIAGTNAATSITTALTANIIGNITGNLSGSVGSLTGHTVQTGDSFGRIGATGSGLTSLAPAAGVALADGAITAAKIATDAITATKIATGAIAADEIAGAACNKIADHIIRRSFVNACDSANGDTKSFRSLLGVVAKLVNKLAISGSTLTIYEEDDITALGTQAITTSETAEPITVLDTV